MSDMTPSISSLQDNAPSFRAVTWSAVVKLLVIVLLVLKLYSAPIESMVYTWKTDGNWSHGWLVPVFSLYFLYVHRDALLAAPRRMNLLGLAVLFVALSLFYVSSLRGFGYPRTVSLVPCLLGLVLLICGWRVLKVAWFPVAYLMFAIPLPRDQYFDVTLPLRRIASVVAGSLLKLLPDVYTEVQGVVVDYDYRGHMGSLNVEEACSGMRLMMAFCSLGVAMAYLGDRPLWHRVVMVIGCVPIAVFCNTIRVFITGMLHVYGYEDWSQGTAHELLGLAMLLPALGMFLLVSYVLNNLFVEEPVQEPVTQ